LSETEQHNLAVAVRYFTGSSSVKLDDGAWPLLWARLRKSPYSAYEFCYYVVHRRHPGKEGPEWHTLTWPNVMVSLDVWEDFMKWKTNRLTTIRLLVRQQNAALRCYLKNDFAADELLEGGRLDMSALVRLENALWLNQTAKLSSESLERLLKKHIAAAVETAVGNPEYLHFTPFFRHWAVQREGDKWAALRWQIQRIETTPTR